MTRPEPNGTPGGRHRASMAYTMVDHQRIRDAYLIARADLLAAREPHGHWAGELSSSALSTATAISALALMQRYAPAALAEETGCDTGQERVSRLIIRGLHWLAAAQNEDGGWGDTDRSLSNIATTMLVRAAFRLTCVPAEPVDVWERSEAYIQAHGGLTALRRRYGKDKTFVVPILTNCALAGLVPWNEVAALPFELACLPQSAFRFLRLPVVSYAIPALVAIGQARYFHARPWNPLTRWVRGYAAQPTLRVLERMQPASGGYLEATPLTSFVVMSLASIGQGGHPVARRGAKFLLHSVREDGSWPIDTNLATWNTTLALNALAAEGDVAAPPDCLDWLLKCQHRAVHPFTEAAPGGWGWSDLSGAVPDADDTSGALLALSHWERDPNERVKGRAIREAAVAGVDWLLGLQNRDGGWPTFCRGWGTLPFDRSGTDLTAHALRALCAWKHLGRAREIDAAIDRGFTYLAARQRPDGSWAPLWFGNQHHPDEENPVYGTAKVLFAYRDLGGLDTDPARRGLAWLIAHQNADGGWGGARDANTPGAQPPRSTVEETSLAVEALSAWGGAGRQDALEAGLDWLVEAVESKCHRDSSPIGFYFAKLWYYEKLYPLIFTVSALGQAVRRLNPRAEPIAAASHLTHA
jgi:squalene-hopene/tetraprenyl-beta-curcumene cyclase